MPGDKWEDKIKHQLNEADVFIMLLSADFMSSEYITEVELKKAFEQFNARKAILIPIYVQPFDIFGMHYVNNEKISDFEILPKREEKLLAISLWPDQDEAFQKITERVRALLTKPK